MKTKFLNKTNFLIFFSIFALILFIFRSLFFNITTNLPDWNDYPLYVWIIYQNISHFSNFAFSEIFNGNIFSPDKGTLLLSDLFIPQSLFGLIISRFIKNPITSFNIIYFISWALNILSTQYFWGKITKNKILVFFGTLATTISSYTLINSVHFQMINYWPFMFGIGNLLDNKITKKNALTTALWITIQFYSGVYLGFFMLFTLAIWYLSNFKKIVSKKTFLHYLNHLSVILLTLMFLTGPLLYNYYLVKQNYNAIRDYGEYVQYSLHLTDYFFPPHLSSMLGKIKLSVKWASFSHSSGYFPGFVIVLSSLVGFFTISKVKKQTALTHVINNKNLFFTLLLVVGLLFSFGPRLSVNGFYTKIPLPYTILLKYVPGFDIIRVTTRWSWLFFLGITFYSIKGFEKIKNYKTIIVVLASILLMIEILPLNKETTTKDYYSYEYKYLEPACNKNIVLLEYPLTQDKNDVDIVTNLTYRTQMMMATIHHECTLINGYTGYIPKDYSEFESELFLSVENNDMDNFLQTIRNRGANIIKLNKNEIFDIKADKIDLWLKTTNQSSVLYTDEDHTIIQLN